MSEELSASLQRALLELTENDDSSRDVRRLGGLLAGDNSGCGRAVEYSQPRAAGLRFLPPDNFPSTLEGHAPEPHFLLVETAGENLVLRWSIVPPAVSRSSSRFSRQFLKFRDRQNASVPPAEQDDAFLHRPHGRRFAFLDVLARTFDVSTPDGIKAWPDPLPDMGVQVGNFSVRLAIDLLRLSFAEIAGNPTEAADRVHLAWRAAVGALDGALGDPSGEFAGLFREMGFGLPPATGRVQGVLRDSSSLRSPVGDALLRHIEARKCVVLQGPPGTGKTYSALRLVDALLQTPDDAGGRLRQARRRGAQWSGLEDHRRHVLLYGNMADHFEDAVSIREREQKPLGEPKVVWELVQMHPGYAYDDFVRGLATRPGQGVHFEAVDRVVLELADVARANPDATVLLIMDEINRCNLASVLGELVLALEPDKRGQPIQLQHGGAVEIPENLWFLGTMNTADRSIALVDYAIRRRFRFIDCPPDPAAIRAYYAERAKPELGEAAVGLMASINANVKSSNLRVGHAYFMEEPGEGWGLRMADRLVYEVLPLLREYAREDDSVLQQKSLALPGVTVDVGSFGDDQSQIQAVHDGLVTALSPGA